jgi:hypothetical protein
MIPDSLSKVSTWLIAQDSIAEAGRSFSIWHDVNWGGLLIILFVLIGCLSFNSKN